MIAPNIVMILTLEMNKRCDLAVAWASKIK
jgi:hypothetical protein